MLPRVSIFEPSEEVVRRFLEGQRLSNLTYTQPGCTEGGELLGFTTDQYRVQLGQGAATFEAACNALRRWGMFPASWTRVVQIENEIQPGQTVAVLIRTCGLWWFNSARIVYVCDGEPRKFGFAYGTLPAHLECGEERFLVEWEDDDSVWYDLRALSRPRSWVTHLGYPVARRLQRRFGRESQRAIAEATRHRS